MHFRHSERANESEEWQSLRLRIIGTACEVLVVALSQMYQLPRDIEIAGKPKKVANKHRAKIIRITVGGGCFRSTRHGGVGVGGFEVEKASEHLTRRNLSMQPRKAQWAQNKIRKHLKSISKQYNVDDSVHEGSS
jgi:hypothetical protein